MLLGTPTAFIFHLSPNLSCCSRRDLPFAPKALMYNYLHSHFLDRISGHFPDPISRHGILQ